MPSACSPLSKTSLGLRCQACASASTAGSAPNGFCQQIALLCAHSQTLACMLHGRAPRFLRQHLANSTNIHQYGDCLGPLIYIAVHCRRCQWVELCFFCDFSSLLEPCGLHFRCPGCPRAALGSILAPLVPKADSRVSIGQPF